jgi:hypothetical protein
VSFFLVQCACFPGKPKRCLSDTSLVKRRLKKSSDLGEEEWRRRYHMFYANLQKAVQRAREEKAKDAETEIIFMNCGFRVCFFVCHAVCFLSWKTVGVCVWCGWDLECRLLVDETPTSFGYEPYRGVVYSLKSKDKFDLPLTKGGETDKRRFRKMDQPFLLFLSFANLITRLGLMPVSILRPCGRCRIRMS